MQYVYLVENRAKTAMKIGTSAMPEVRAGGLGCRLLFTMRGNRHTEKMLHERFRHVRISGEWFKHSAQIAGYFLQSGGRMVRGRPPKKIRNVNFIGGPVRKELAEEVRRLAKEKGMFLHHMLEQALELWLKEQGA